MLTIRMRRLGAKKRPFFRVVVTEARSARDGRSLEVLGYYDPAKQPEVLHVNQERLQHWMYRGAQPSDTVRTLLARQRAGAERMTTTSKGEGAGEAVPAVEAVADIATPAEPQASAPETEPKAWAPETESEKESREL